VIVIDASVAVDFLLGRVEADRALAAAVADDPDQRVHAPELIDLEALNALRGLARAGLVSEERAGEAAADLGDLRLVRHPHAPLRERVWALRHELTAYDAAYLALAEILDEPLLITGDAGLATAAARSLGRTRVVLAG
jgi:predicted nucleic acid-binding protein